MKEIERSQNGILLNQFYWLFLGSLQLYTHIGIRKTFKSLKTMRLLLQIPALDETMVRLPPVTQLSKTLRDMHLFLQFINRNMDRFQEQI